MDPNTAATHDATVTRSIFRRRPIALIVLAALAIAFATGAAGDFARGFIDGFCGEDATPQVCRG